MPTISEDVALIRTAVYGKDVREAIADGIEKTSGIVSDIQSDYGDVPERVSALEDIIGDTYPMYEYGESQNLAYMVNVHPGRYMSSSGNPGDSSFLCYTDFIKIPDNAESVSVITRVERSGASSAVINPAIVLYDENHNLIEPWFSSGDNNTCSLTKVDAKYIIVNMPLDTTINERLIRFNYIDVDYRFKARVNESVYTFSDFDLPFRFENSYPTSLYMYYEDTNYKSKKINAYAGQRIRVEGPFWSTAPFYVFVYMYNGDCTRKERVALRTDNTTELSDYAVIPSWAKHVFIQFGSSHTVPTVQNTAGIKIFVLENDEGAPDASDDEEYSVYNPLAFENGQITGAGLDMTWAVSNGTRHTSNLVQVQSGDIIYSSSNTYNVKIVVFSSFTSKSSFTVKSRSYEDEGKYHFIKSSGIAMLQVSRVDEAVIGERERLNLPNYIVGVSKKYRGDIRVNTTMTPTCTDYYAQFEAMLSDTAYTKTVLCTEQSPSHYPVNLYIINHNNKGIRSTSYDVVNRDLGHEKKVLIVASLHGNEKGASVAVHNFVDNLLHNSRYSWMLGAYAFYVVPIANPFGYSHHINDSNGEPMYLNGSSVYDGPGGQYVPVLNTNPLDPGVRMNYNGYNLNRDFSDRDVDVTEFERTVTYGFKTPETRAIRDLIIANNFYQVIDVHQHVYGRNIETEPNYYVCGMARMQVGLLNTDDGKTDPFYKYTGKACGTADAYLSEYIGKAKNFEDLRMSFVWERDYNLALSALRNYAAGYSYNNCGNIDHTDVSSVYGVTVELTQCAQTLCFSRNVPYSVHSLYYGAVYLTEIIDKLLQIKSDGDDGEPSSDGLVRDDIADTSDTRSYLGI